MTAEKSAGTTVDTKADAMVHRLVVWKAGLMVDVTAVQTVALMAHLLVDDWAEHWVGVKVDSMVDKLDHLSVVTKVVVTVDRMVVGMVDNWVVNWGDQWAGM